MKSSLDTKKKAPLTLAGIIITVGIVFGDIGTSPLYVFQAISGGGKNFSKDLIFGGVSSVFWTLVLLASIKYIWFALNADNKGEGGIFALYALLKKKKIKWLIFPTLIGCASLLADGFITPAISISSAVEGLRYIQPDIQILPIVVGIIFALFSIQQFGTNALGKAFGPIMILWFITLAYLGLININKNPEVIAALNPYYVYNLIVNVDGGFWIFGAVSLCITGAETLYSDLGHCGKQNIRISWNFIIVCLLLNYLGQAAACTVDNFTVDKGQTVFYEMVPKNLITYVVIIASLSSIIASQALITGIFTLMNEAVKLKLWTNLKIKYPTDHHGQIYIPLINWFLMFGCLLVLLIFKESEKMGAAYGLAININMIMTSMLLCFLLVKKYPKAKLLYIFIFSVFLMIELIFLSSNMGKIVSGGWFALILSTIFFTLLFFFYKARQLRSRMAQYIPMSKAIPLLNAVRNDPQIAFEATNLVYPTRSDKATKLDATVFYSLFKKKPRKAEVIWFLHMDITSEPYGISYSVEEVIDKHCYYVSVQLGFKEEHRLEYMLRKIHKNLVEKGELKNESVFECIRGQFEELDFKFVMLNSRIATDNMLTTFQSMYVKTYRFIKKTGLKSSADFGLDETNVIEEYIPITVAKQFIRDMNVDSLNIDKK